MFHNRNMYMSFNFGEEILIILIIKGFTKMGFIFILVGSSIWFIIM